MFQGKFEKFRSNNFEITTNLTSIEGFQVTLEVNETTNPAKDVVWIMVTAIVDKQPIGFIDVRFYPNGELAEIESSHLRTSGIFDAPYSEIRDIDISGDDGFYILEEERGRGIGSEMFSVILATLKNKGAKELVIKGARKESFPFYDKFGGKRFGYDLYLFKLI